tara:strand:- start:41 stop:394 length:354 start_codon:yes stop_codon:yes gene_type:complete
MQEYRGGWVVYILSQKHFLPILVLLTRLGSLDWEKKMKNILLGVIAVCLFMITLKLYIPEASAEVSDKEFEDAVNKVVYGPRLKRYMFINIEVSCSTNRRTIGKRSYSTHGHDIVCE